MLGLISLLICFLWPKVCSMQSFSAYFSTNLPEGADRGTSSSSGKLIWEENSAMLVVIRTVLLLNQGDSYLGLEFSEHWAFIYLEGIFNDFKICGLLPFSVGMATCTLLANTPYMSSSVVYSRCHIFKPSVLDIRSLWVNLIQGAQHILMSHSWTVWSAHFQKESWGKQPQVMQLHTKDTPEWHP